MAEGSSCIHVRPRQLGIVPMLPMLLLLLSNPTPSLFLECKCSIQMMGSCIRTGQLETASIPLFLTVSQLETV